MQPTDKLKRMVPLLVLAVVSLIILYVFYSYSFIEVSVAGESNKASLTLSKQGDFGESEDITGSRKKLVRRGNYEIALKNDGGSFISYRSAGGFLSTTRVEAALTSEKSRTYVGDNPAPCMHLKNQVLLSYGCGGLLKNMQIHLPADDSQPTYVKTLATIAEGTIQDILETPAYTLLLERSPAQTEEGAEHILYQLNNEFQLQEGVAMSDLRAEDDYKLQRHEDGFIVYSITSAHVLFYPSYGQAPEDFSQDDIPENVSLFDVSSLDETYLLAFTNNQDGDLEDVHDIDTDKIQSTLIVRSGSVQKSFIIQKPYSAAELCAPNRVCLISNNRMDVYDYSADKLKLLYQVDGVLDLAHFNKRLLAVRQSDLLSLDVEKAEGYVMYSLVTNGYCGLHVSSVGPIVCSTNSKSNKVALLINPEVNSDGIDNKVNELLQHIDVSAVSAYRNYIYVSPVLSDLAYDEASNSFGYDPVEKAKVNSRINEFIDELKISGSIYTIKNTAQ